MFSERQSPDAEIARISPGKNRKPKKSRPSPMRVFLDGVPRGLPALQRAARFIEKVTKVGFQ